MSLAVELLEAVRDPLSANLLSPSGVKWVSVLAGVPFDPESKELFVRHGRFVRERGILFGTHQLSSTVTAGRLCVRAALEFTAAISLEPLSFCHDCLHNAATGINVNTRSRDKSHRDSAALSLRLLGEQEFGGGTDA
jgi:hypothetical protein